ADEATVREEIVTMPHYFEPYDTTVTFLSAEELARDHQGMPHGGFVIRSGESSPGTTQTIEYRLQEDSNPEFTASVVVAYARAAARMAAAGQHGAQTPFDVAPGLLSPKSPEQLRAELLCAPAPRAPTACARGSPHPGDATCLTPPEHRSGWETPWRTGILFSRCRLRPAHGGRSSVGRAPGCGPGGRGFKSRRSPQMCEV